MALNQVFAQNALKHVGQGASTFRKWYYGSDLKGVAWCAVFVSYIANQTGILNKIVKKCEGAGNFPREGVPAGWGKWYEGNSKPQVGDIILFTWNGQGRYQGYDAYYSDHVGIVYKVDSNYVYTVEGNTDGTNDTSIVTKRKYALNSGLINGYYRPNWSAVKKTTASQTTNTVKKETAPDVTYRVRCGGKWLPAVKNLEDYAGLTGKAITDVAIKVSKGKVKYRVHNKGGSWLPYVTGYNTNDYYNGYAGSGKTIDAVEIVYTPEKGKSYKAKYRVSALYQSYYDWQRNNDKSNGQDGYAGLFGNAIDKLQIVLSK